MWPASASSADDLGDHEPARQQRGEADAALVCGMPVVVRMTVTGGVPVAMLVGVIVCVSVGVLHRRIARARMVARVN
jgi:hypothetical protein